MVNYMWVVTLIILKIRADLKFICATKKNIRLFDKNSHRPVEAPSTNGVLLTSLIHSIT